MHPNEEKLRAAYDVFGQGDLDVRTNHIYDFGGGMFSRWEEWPASTEAFNEAWS